MDHGHAKLQPAATEKWQSWLNNDAVGNWILLDTICHWYHFCQWGLICHWFSFLCEQVLFVYVFTLIPPHLTDQRNFITVRIVTREPEQTTLLFWSAACGVTPQPTGDSRQCVPFSNLFSTLIFWPLVCLPTFCSPCPFYAPSNMQYILAS